MKNKIEIPISKKKMVLLIGGSLLFVALGIWLFINANELQDGSGKIMRNQVVVKSLGIVSILFFGSIGILNIKKIFDRNVGIVIDDMGITNYSNASNIGLIEWCDISRISTYQVMSTRILLIEVINPEKYINKAKGKVVAQLMKVNLKMYGTPLSISANTLAYDFSELEKVIKTEFERSRNEN